MHFPLPNIHFCSFFSSQNPLLSSKYIFSTIKSLLASFLQLLRSFFHFNSSSCLTLPYTSKYAWITRYLKKSIFLTFHKATSKKYHSFLKQEFQKKTKEIHITQERAHSLKSIRHIHRNYIWLSQV